MEITVPLWAVLATVCFVAVLLVLIWSGRRTLIAQVDTLRFDAGIEALLPNIAAVTGTPAVGGNRVEVLQNGDGFFGRLLDDVAAAEQSVHYETYVWWTGDICGRFAAALAAKAREGVEVRLILDAQGCLPMDSDLLDQMVDAGCLVEKFHPFDLRHLGKVNSRNHRKMAVIDGRIAYFMGHGISGNWEGDARTEDEWRDTAVRIRGPGVHHAQAVFLSHWLHVHDELPLQAEHFPNLEEEGGATVHITESDPVGAYSEIEVLLKTAIASAQESIRIQNPYFVPDRSVVDLLAERAAEGIDVRITLPEINDSVLVRAASHKYYTPLLESGVKLYEYRKTFAHQKVVVIDGLWSLVGSANFDHRTLEINREVTVGILDREIARQLTEAFDADLRHSREITLEEWRGRPLYHQIGSNLAFMIRQQL